MNSFFFHIADSFRIRLDELLKPQANLLNRIFSSQPTTTVELVMKTKEPLKAGNFQMLCALPIHFLPQRTSQPWTLPSKSNPETYETYLSAIMFQMKFSLFGLLENPEVAFQTLEKITSWLAMQTSMAPLILPSLVQKSALWEALSHEKAHLQILNEPDPKPHCILSWQYQSWYHSGAIHREDKRVRSRSVNVNVPN